MRKLRGQTCSLLSAIALLLILTAASRHAWPQTPPAPLDLNRLGAATLPVDGAWQFHVGDNPVWATPGFDDSSWQSIETGRTWEQQGDRNYTGFAWYRRHLSLGGGTPGHIRLALLLSDVDSACDVYWNGALVGSVGRVPPHPVWYWPASRPSRVIVLGAAQSGVLAIRVWKAPYVLYNFPSEGGLIGVPRIGSVDAVTNLQAARRGQWLRSHQLDIAVKVVSAVVSLICLVFWLRDRRRTLLLWLAIATAFPLAGFLLIDVPGQVRFQLAYSLWGIMISLNDLAVWFLLIALLGLESRKSIVRWTKILGVVLLGLMTLEFLVGQLNWTGPHAHLFLVYDIASGIPWDLIEFWGVVVVLSAFRWRLDAPRWILATAALLNNLVQVIDDSASSGMRWTHWTFERFLDNPLFTLAGNGIVLRDVTETMMLAAILYVTWRYTVEQNQRRNAIESELRNARAVQQVLIPEEIPNVPGFRIESVYKPAGEVGGDFFQILPAKAGGVLLVIGDVSGKGMPAAMTVSLLVGTFRTLAHFTQSPGEILTSMNERMLGRSQGGFTTCLILHVDPDGAVTAANAGHLSPYRNGEELLIESGLPLGLAEGSSYSELQFRLGPGDRLTLLTDGVVEARNPSGDLFGFEHARSISTQSAVEIAAAAQAHGQEDDITVLTLTFASPEMLNA